MVSGLEPSFTTINRKTIAVRDNTDARQRSTSANALWTQTTMSTLVFGRVGRIEGRAGRTNFSDAPRVGCSIRSFVSAVPNEVPPENPPATTVSFSGGSGITGRLDTSAWVPDRYRLTKATAESTAVGGVLWRSR